MTSTCSNSGTGDLQRKRHRRSESESESGSVELLLVSKCGASSMSLLCSVAGVTTNTTSVAATTSTAATATTTATTEKPNEVDSKIETALNAVLPQLKFDSLSLPIAHPTNGSSRAPLATSAILASLDCLTPLTSPSPTLIVIL